MTLTRERTVLEDLERTLRAFIRRHKITHDEYRFATDILIRSIKSGEESLLCDVFFEADTTDNDNLDRPGSVAAVEGPFYLPNAPQLKQPYTLPQRHDETGEILILRGRVTSLDGTALSGAELDMWQADAAGLYSNIHVDTPDWNLRGRFQTDADGMFEVRTIVPPPYEIPKNGPTGQVLKTLGRHFFRPAHLHLKIRHPRHEEVTSQLYFKGGDYLKSDVAQAVREAHITPLLRQDDATEMAARKLSKPYFEARHDIVLVPSES